MVFCGLTCKFEKQSISVKTIIMKRRIILTVWALCMLGLMGSQAQNERAATEKCASALIHNRLMSTDPTYKARVLANEARIQAIINSQKVQKTGGPNQTQATVYTIPVVVHVIHLGESVGSGTNISDAQIQSAIDNLTDAYRNQSPYTGVDVEVEFALAQRDPNCNATNGIVRIDGSGTSDYATNGLTTSGTDNEATIKALSKWPNSTYYNIWVVAGIDGNMGGGGVQGFAYFPGASSSIDGAVILYNSFGYDPTGTLGYNLKSYTNRNVTTIHELGHAFNLYHTFEGDGSGSTCPTGNQCGSGLGDCCSDTPPHMRSASNCNTSGTNSCDGGSSNSLFVHNFMDYSSDACQTEFTTAQAARMRAALESSRGGLLNSLATTAPSGSMPTAACIPVEQNVGSYPIGVYGLTFNTLNVSSSSANADGGYVDRTCYYQTTVTAGTAVTVTVNTGTSYNHDVRMYIDFNNDGDFADSGETVFSSDNVMTTHTGTITIPASPPVTGQVLRMRVLADYFSGTISSACYNPLYGQAEDFGLIINAAAGSPPVANFTATPTSLCAGGSVSFTDQSTNTPTSWSWTFQGGSPSTSTSQNPSVTYTAAGTYSVSLTATNSSGSDAETKTAYITVNALPTVGAGASANPVCSGSSTILSGSGASSYTWTGGVTNGVAFTPSGTSSYTVTGTDGNGCTNTASITVTVTPTPTVNVSGTMTITSGNSTTLTATGATSYSWTPSTGLSATTGSSVVASPTATTAYTVTGSTSGCSGTKAFTITVNAPGAPPVANFSATPTTLCAGSTAAFSDMSSNSPTSWSWTFQGGNPASSTSQNPTVTYTAAGTYSVSLTATNNDGSDVETKTAYITVNALPVVTGTASANPVCSGASTTLSGGGASSYLWSGGVTNGVPFAPSSTATYTVTGTDGNGCSNTATLTVTVTPTPTVGVSGTMTITSGGSTTVTATGASSYSWTPSTGLSSTTGASVVASPTTTTSYTVTGTTSGCTDAEVFTITVNTVAVGPTNLQSAYCGITETSLTQFLHCVSVTSASNYRYELTDIGNNSVLTYVRGTNLTSFQMSQVTGIGYAKTYSIRVAAYVGGTWTAYGTACNITTPAAPTTQLAASYCGVSLSSLSQPMNCVQIAGATNYRYELTDLSNNTVIVYTRGANTTSFQMDWVSGTAYNKTYSIRVAAYAGSWLAYGPSCNVTTPVTATTQLLPAYCGITLTTLSQSMNCVAVAGASNYRYELTDLSNNNVLTYTRGANTTSFAMSWVSGVMYATTYSVRVAAYVGGAWLAYSTACTITTPASATTQLRPAYCGISLSALNQVLYCDAVAGASNYRYEITDLSTNTVYTYYRGANVTSLYMNLVTGVTTGKTYGVKVAAYATGIWMAYGNACNVTTPAALIYNPGDAALVGDPSDERSHIMSERFTTNLYPNPNDGHAYLNVSKDAKIRVSNLLGEVMYEGEVHGGTNELYFLDARPGMYLIILTDGVDTVQMRMIKE